MREVVPPESAISFRFNITPSEVKKEEQQGWRRVRTKKYCGQKFSIMV
jgi:hypothetical protein